FALRPVTPVNSWRPRSISLKICRRSSGCSCAIPAARTHAVARAAKTRFQRDADINHSGYNGCFICLNTKEKIVGRPKGTLYRRLSGQRHVRHQQAEAEEGESPAVGAEKSPPRIPQVANGLPPFGRH